MWFMRERLTADVDPVSMSATASDIAAPSPGAAAAPTTSDAPRAADHAQISVPPVDSDGFNSAHETIIQPTRGWIAVNWREMFESRELLYFLIWRDLKVRYKQAILGVGWAVVVPIMNMILYTVIFGSAAGLNKRLPGHESQYNVFVYAALLPWGLFASAMQLGGLSLVNQQNILKKIYFPRLFVPTAAVGAALMDMAISFAIVMALAWWKEIVFTPWLLGLPLLVALNIFIALGVAYLLSALTVKYRDFRFLINFMTQILVFLSFVAFPPALVAGSKLRYLLVFNPMYGVIASFRKCILGWPDDVTGFSWIYLASSIVGGAVLFVLGIFVFRRTERNFADIA